ncbi:hypothetical protein B7494_g3001 [Chlorociboria aeruginascens]|nr:hypothetical protein B7494_g3001 [Chlorociboria aeruginascens]
MAGIEYVEADPDRLNALPMHGIWINGPGYYADLTVYQSIHVLKCAPPEELNRRIWTFKHVSATSEIVTGPIGFLWPEQRPWYAAWQTRSPCGTNDATPGNRTDFPLDSGKVALVIAGDTWDITIRIAYMNKPTTQSDFTTEITVSEIEAGHECYTTPDTPSNTAAGSNATIQVEYTTTYNGSANETFYACADIAFVEESNFTANVSCFNVSATAASSNGVETTTAFSTSTSTGSASASALASDSSSDLSPGAKAGIAVGCIVGGVALLAAGMFVLMRKTQYKPRFRGRQEVDKAVQMKRLSDKSQKGENAQNMRDR